MLCDFRCRRNDDTQVARDERAHMRGIADDYVGSSAEGVWQKNGRAVVQDVSRSGRYKVESGAREKVGIG